MEEFFLRLFLAGDELHVINDKHVDITVAVRKSVLLEADTIKEFTYERLGTDIEHTHVGMFSHDLVAHRLDQVGFAKSDAAIEKEGIVLGARG